MANLAVHSEYQGPDRVRMDNGTSLPIRSTGASLLCSPALFVLKNFLHVPDISKKILSVSQFTADNKVFLEFYSDSCFIKSIRKTLLRGQLKDGLHVFFLGNHSFTVSPQAFLDEHASSSVWHERLGYLSTIVVSRVYLNIGFLSLLIVLVPLSTFTISKKKVTVSLFRHLSGLLLLL